MEVIENNTRRMSPELKKLKKSVSERSLKEAIGEYKKVEQKQSLLDRNDFIMRVKKLTLRQLTQ
jgi:hypothetical protein